mgnify:FL=1
MPRSQVANIGVYNVGAPVTAGAPGDVVLQFSQRDGRGALLTIVVENAEGSANATLTYEVSADNSTFAATTAAANGTAVNGVTLRRKEKLTHTIRLRPSRQGSTGTQGDLWFRIRASGGTRIEFQVRGDENLVQHDLVKGVVHA